MASETTSNPRVNEIDGKSIASTTSSTNADQNGTILDRNWVKHAFLLNDTRMGTNKQDIVNRYWSSASAKFTDTRLGGNIGINSRPQFTRYSDIRDPGRNKSRQNVSLSNSSGNYGMGRYYSEAIDDPAQTIYLRFGVPQFNTLTNFISKAFNAEMSSVARTGRSKSAFYSLGKLAGTVGFFAAFPYLAIGIVASRTASSFFMRSDSKFYTLKPTMHVYWSTVNLLVNTLAINRGIFPKVESKQVGTPYKLDKEYLQQITELMPDVFRGSDYFDMYAIANKAQRMSNYVFRQDYDALENSNSGADYTGYVKSSTDGRLKVTAISDSFGEKPSLFARLAKFVQFGSYSFDNNSAKMEIDPRHSDDAKKKQAQDEFFQYFDAEFADGSQFAVFKVDLTGSVSESFGSSATESDVSQKLNSLSSQAREARFSFADGNIMGGVGAMAKEAIGAVKDVAVGVMDGVTMGFGGLLTGLAGNGYVDIPKHWQSSTASLPRSSYTMQLISPYGNPISQMQNILIPLSMLLAGALPLSTGKQSYTSPFLCQLFDRGRCQVKLGMIESLSINRGVSNLPFDTKGNALAIDVTFSVMDLSSLMHMPVSNGSLLSAIADGAQGSFDMTLDEDNILADYLAVLAGQDLYTQIYTMPKAKLTFAKRMMQVRKMTSPAYWASMVHESGTSGMLQYVSLGATKVLEGLSRPSSITSGPFSQ